MHGWYCEFVLLTTGFICLYLSALLHLNWVKHDHLVVPVPFEQPWRIWLKHVMNMKILIYAMGSRPQKCCPYWMGYTVSTMWHRICGNDSVCVNLSNSLTLAWYINTIPYSTTTIPGKGDFRYKDKIVVSLSYIHYENSCDGKTSSLYWWPLGGRFKNTYELLNQRALKFSYVNKIHIFQCMGKIFCVEFQRYPLKFHTKYLTHTLKDMIFMQFWNFKSS